MIFLSITLFATVFATFLNLGWSCSAYFERPCRYAMYSPFHTSCKVRNPYCKIFDAGLNEKDKAVIVDEHNKYRNKIATGWEIRGGRMPQATNMLQMVWDEELASIAQIHAEQCKMEYDRPELRQVDRFPVGQNIYQLRKASITPKPKEDFFRKGLETLYNEVNDFNPLVLNSFQKSIMGKGYNQFTQMIWAKTWKLGCGYVEYLDMGWTSQLLVCNYGPAGNVPGQPIYDVGLTASQCPINYIISSQYPGLCQSTRFLSMI